MAPDARDTNNCQEQDMNADRTTARTNNPMSFIMNKLLPFAIVAVLIGGAMAVGPESPVLSGAVAAEQPTMASEYLPARLTVDATEPAEHIEAF